MAVMRFFKGWLWPFKLLRRYTSQQLGPGRDDPGRIYESSHLLTGNPAVVLIPSEHAPMEPQEEWRVRLRSQSHPPLLSLEVEQAPPSGQLSQLRGMLALLGTSIERLGNSEEARAHLTRQPWRFADIVVETWSDYKSFYRWMRASLWRTLGICLGAPSIVLFILFLGAFARFVYDIHECEAQTRAAHEEAVPSVSRSRAPILVDMAGEDPTAIAYPLPPRPFSDQAKAPCNPRKGQVEINGGCWVELAKSPPCYEDQAEYQGKCYLPVSARSQKREPRSIHP